MPILSHSSRLRHHAAVVLALFAWAFAVTTIAPWMEPADAGCGRSGALDAGARSGAVHPGDAPVDHAAHCPLCMPVGAPPAFAFVDFATSAPVDVVPSLRTVDAPSRFVVVPPPARGPPVSA